MVCPIGPLSEVSTGALSWPLSSSMLLLTAAASFRVHPEESRSGRGRDSALTPSEEQVERERVEEEAATSLKFVLWVLIALALAAVGCTTRSPDLHEKKLTSREKPGYQLPARSGRHFSIQRSTHED